MVPLKDDKSCLGEKICFPSEWPFGAWAFHTCFEIRINKSVQGLIGIVSYREMEVGRRVE